MKLYDLKAYTYSENVNAVQDVWTNNFFIFFFQCWQFNRPLRTFIYVSTIDFADPCYTYDHTFSGYFPI